MTIMYTRNTSNTKDVEILINPTKEELSSYLDQNRVYRLICSKDKFAIWDLEDDLIHSDVARQFQIFFLKDFSRLYLRKDYLSVYNDLLLPYQYDNKERLVLFRQGIQADRNSLLKQYFPNLNMETKIRNFLKYKPDTNSDRIYNPNKEQTLSFIHNNKSGYISFTRSPYPENTFFAIYNEKEKENVNSLPMKNFELRYEFIDNIVKFYLDADEIQEVKYDIKENPIFKHYFEKGINDKVCKIYF